VRVEFRTKKLQRCYVTHGMAVQQWGDKVARTYVKAVDALKAAEAVQDLYALPQFDCHPLRENRAGQYSMTLAYRHRLIFTVSEQGVELIALVEEVETQHYE
jgi:proteic killer suppression protein